MSIPYKGKQLGKLFSAGRQASLPQVLRKGKKNIVFKIYFLRKEVGNQVFEAEKMVAASGWYHRHCFRWEYIIVVALFSWILKFFYTSNPCRCSFCAQPLDSTSVCDGPDNKIYCRVCYGKIRFDMYFFLFGNCRSPNVAFLFRGSSKPRFLDGANIETWTIQVRKTMFWSKN